MPDNEPHDEDRRDEHTPDEGTPEEGTPNEGAEHQPDPESQGEAEAMSAAFFQEVMQGLSDTNFAHGWGDSAMYRDFLTWCESSEEADAIIAAFSPKIPSLLVDPDDNVRLISLHAQVATDLMRALLEAYEVRRIEDLFSR